MAKSNGRHRRGSGTVTVIEQQVHRSSIRNAKIAFWVVGVTAAVLIATVAASYTHPVIAVAIGIAAGTCVALPVAGLIWIWPVLRVLWWWTPEVAIAGGLLLGWVELAAHTPMAIRIAITITMIGVPAVIPQIRCRIIAWAWCFITRHRLRVCFNEFIITNRTGSLPLILWAHPTPVGERVWIYLRPGLSLDDLQNRLDKIAPACWADTVTVERASESNAAYIRLDIKRRQVMVGTIGSPLTDMVDPNAPATERNTGAIPTALNLTDITPESVTTTAKRDDTKQRTRATTTDDTVTATAGTNDVSDWI